MQSNAQRSRRFSYHMRRAIKQENKRLEYLDIIEKMEDPQDWISNLVVVPKSNGNVPLCLDTRTLNMAIKRKTYPVPTFEVITVKMSCLA